MYSNEYNEKFDIQEDEDWHKKFVLCEDSLDKLIDLMLHEDKFTELEIKELERQEYIESHEMTINEEFAMNDISDKIWILR